MPSTRFRPLALSLSVFFSPALAAAPARAAPSDAELATARELFVEAERDEDAGRWIDALEKLRRISWVKQTAGVQYHQALCEEHLGQLATALTDYAAAGAQARSEDAQDVLGPVATRLAELSPRVPRLTIRVIPDVPGTTVTLDGEVLTPSRMSSPIPVDPGVHRVEATATDFSPAVATVTLQERDATVLDLKLARVPNARAEPVQVAVTRKGRSRTWALGATVGAVVLAAGGVGAYLAAGSEHERAKGLCSRLVSTSTTACDSEKNNVRAWDWVAASAWAAAALSATVAVYSWTASTRRAAERGDVQVLLGAGSIGVGGSF
jgi:hypothetical protein